MEAGKHVLIEKPMTRYLSEGFDVYDTCKRTKRVMQIGAVFCLEKKMAQSGAVGSRRHDRTTRARPILLLPQ